MIVVRLMGGLGNQMFQYAAGLGLARARGTGLKLDHSFLEDRTPRQDFTQRDYHLHLVGVEDSRATPQEVRRYRRALEPDQGDVSWWQRWQDRMFPCHVHVEPAPPVFDPAFISLPRRTFLEGYFQDERYFASAASELRVRFRKGLAALPLPPEAVALAAKLRATEAICMHIRRGDYVSIAPTAAFHGTMSLGYYERGLRELRARGVEGPVYVFSDDQAWCRAHLPKTEQLHFVSEDLGGESGTIHMHLMTLCRHFLISNSTFAWWAAWLAEDSTDRVVFRPSAWFRNPAFRQIHPCPPAWLPLEDPAIS